MNFTKEIASNNRKIIEDTYREIFEQWYGGLNIEMAELEIEFLDIPNSCGYSNERNTIFLSLPTNEITQIDNESIFNLRFHWEDWYSDLVHEMLHEYQFKVIKTSTPQGEKLLNTVNKALLNFDGPGHDEVFYSAIFDRADFFELAPIDVVKRI